MIVFLDTKSGRTIGVNPKAMFSFFASDDRFRKTDAPADFLIARNPFNRSISFYFDKIGSRRPIQQICQNIILEFIQQKNFDGFEFADFCRALPQIHLLEDHLFPQTRGIDLDGIKIIQMETQLPQLALKLEIDFSRKENAVNHPSAGQLYSPETAAIIQNIYCDDFEKLGYNKDYESLR